MKTLPGRPHKLQGSAPPFSFPRMQTPLVAFAISLFVILIGPANIPTAYAQMDSLRFERISTEQGLSQNTVTSILQDHQGYLWFGTEGGLNRYDGYQFTVYQHDPENPQSLDDNAVNSLIEDHTGTMWVGTASGLNRYDPATGAFVHYAHDASQPTSLGGSFVLAICEDRAGALWIGTDDGGLDAFDRGTGKFTHYRHSAQDPESLSDDSVNAIYQDHDGTLWIGTNAGLDRFDPAIGTFAHFRQSPASGHLVNDYTVLSILEHKGALWVGTRSGLVQLDRLSGKFVVYRNSSGDVSSLGSDSVAFLYEDREGALWLGTRAGLDRLEDGQNRFVHYRYDRNDPHGLSSDYVRSIYQDRSGVLWVGTSDGGLSKDSPSGQKFALYQSRPGASNSLSDNNVWSIYQAHDGMLWIGTFFAGLNALDPQTGAVTVYKHDLDKPGSLSSDEVRVIMEDSSGNLWVGLEHGGLDRLDRTTGTFVHFQHDPNNSSSLSDNDVFAIYEDQEKRLWVGTQNGGLNRLNPADGTFTHYLNDLSNPSSLSHNTVESIYQDNSGGLWVGTLGGLNLWDAGHDGFVHYRHDSRDASSLSTDMVACVMQDANGTVWVGTFGGGLNRFDRATHTFAHYTVKNGLADDTVYGSLADENGFLWLSTNKGLARFDPRTAMFRNYTASDGLQGSQFNPRAYFKSPTGEMFFGGVQGLNAFYPDQVLDDTFAPPVVITSFKMLNQAVQADLTGKVPIQLSYQDYVISFEFAALDFNAPDKNQYAYKLEGVDPDWVYAGTRHFASYTNLSGGDYVFRLKASNSDGVWGQEELALKVQVAPPFWETWWFRGGLAAALLLGALSAYWVRMRSMRVRHRELESQVEQRTHELAALNTIATAVNRSLDLKEILNEALDKTLEIMHLDIGLAFRLEEREGDPGDGLYLSLLAQRGMSELVMPAVTPLSLRGSILEKAVSAGMAMVWDNADYSNPQWSQVVRNEGIELGISVPLFAKGKPVGAIALGAHSARTITMEELSLLGGIGAEVGIAVENARLYDRAEQSAQIAERSRLARELHDSVTQSLYSVTLYAEAAARLLAAGDSVAAVGHMRELRDTAQDALREMRLLIFELRLPVLEKSGLVVALQSRLDAVETRGGMRVEMQVDGKEQLPPTVQVELYHVAMESLNNVLKHAKAQHVQVHLQFLDTIVCLEICDDGTGFDPAVVQDRGGQGLRGMQERAQKIGGVIEIVSGPGRGTKVTVRVPLIAVESGHAEELRSFAVGKQ